MYKCRLTYDEWKSMKKKSWSGRFMHTDDFEGYVGILTIDEVSEAQICNLFFNFLFVNSFIYLSSYLFCLSKFS